MLDNRYISETPRLTRLRKRHQVSANPLELRRRHADRGGVLRLRDTEMLLINVHKLDIVFAQPIALAAFEDEVEAVGSILGFEGEDVLILGTS
jgi:hypothetical protein